MNLGLDRKKFLTTLEIQREAQDSNLGQKLVIGKTN
jgi:hypothetical protein